MSEIGDLTNKQGKDGDVLAGVEAKDWSWCKKANTPIPSSYGKGHRFILANGVNDCDGKDHFRLLPEPAVRKAMVEWIRKEANHPRPHAAIANQAIRMLADRLEAGGGER